MQNSKFDFLRKALPFFLACCAGVLFFAPPAPAQNSAQPRREQLLNGLKLVVLPDSKSANVTVKLRIHAGAAFDPAGKEGTMRLLADILFPEEGTRPFFEEELGGKLKVESNYDFLEITASGRADEFERILDTVRSAALAPPIAPDTFKRVRDARLQIVQSADQTAAAIADRAARKRLFGDFPYARSADGTAESLAKIDRNDLLFARDRFLTADNATLLIAGNVKDSYAVRAAKQLFGPWRKADRAVPATFRQPDAPDQKILIVDAPDSERAEIRVALRGLARGDKDFAAAQILARLAEARLRSDLPDSARAGFSVSADNTLLPGAIVFRASAPTPDAARTLAAIRGGIAKMSQETFKFAELSDYQKFFAPQPSQDALKTEDAAEIWLDADTYKIAPNRAAIQPTPADVNRLAAQIFKTALPAIVVVGDAEQIQPQLDGK